MAMRQWTKSRRCESNGCVEVAAPKPDKVGLRNSAKPEVTLYVAPDVWDGFLLDIKEEGKFRFQ